MTLSRHLCIRYKHLLKSQVGVPWANYVGQLRIDVLRCVGLVPAYKRHRMLESPHSSPQQKLGVLSLVSSPSLADSCALRFRCRLRNTMTGGRGLSRARGEPSEIYLNYDCDVEGKDVFEQMVRVADLFAVALFGSFSLARRARSMLLPKRSATK